MSSRTATGRYQVVGRIAAGGMGEVFYATMESMGGVRKPVALKVVRPRPTRDPHADALFVEEVKVAMSLSHANIVQAFDVGRIDDRWFLAMEYVDGVDLATLISSCDERLAQRLPRPHAVFVAIEICKGLDYAHRRKGPTGEPLDIVHRDVSPGNVLVSREGEVKVADFGIAKSTLREVASIAGTVKGKLPYMAPEQLRAHGVDRRADLYSVGAVLYEMLSGQRVVAIERGPSAIPDVLSGDHPRPREIDPTIPPALEAIVERALSVDPEARQPSAAALRQDLERFAHAEGYLLSSADLADLVLETCTEPLETRRTRALGGFGATAPPATPSPAAPAQIPDPALDFDAILGRELAPVATDEPFSVFTTSARVPRAQPPAARAPRAQPQTDLLREGPSKSTPAPAPAPAPTPRPRTDSLALPTSKTPWLAAAALLAATAIGAVIAIAMNRTPTPTPTPTPTANPAPDPDPTSDPVPAPDSDPVPVPVPAPVPDSDSAPAPVPVPVPVPDSDPVPVPVPVPVPDPSSSSSPIPRFPRPRSPSLLSANTDPWSNVFVDNRPVGATPLVGFSLPSGTHRLRFESPSQHLSRTVVVDIAPGEHRRVTLSLADPGP